MYSMNDADVESARPHLAGFVVREHSRVESNFRSAGSWSEQWGVVAIDSIDTRASCGARIARRNPQRAIDHRPRRRQPCGQSQGKPRPRRPTSSTKSFPTAPSSDDAAMDAFLNEQRAETPGPTPTKPFPTSSPSTTA